MNGRRSSLLWACLLWFLLIVNPAGAMASEGQVTVIPIQGEITQALSDHVIAEINSANNRNDKAILLEIDTYGGQILAAERIKDAVLHSRIRVISYVTKKAVSAGVLIAISANDLYMAPGTHMGAAETIPATEKVLSAWVGQLRATAEYRKRNSDIVAAMADKSIALPGIIAKDRLLDITAEEALRIQFIDGISENQTDVLQKRGLEKAVIYKAPTDPRVMIAQFLTTTTVSTILFTAGIIALVIELFTAGFGIAGFISILCFGLYFGGGMLAGQTEWWAVLLFALGILFLLIEFIIPGFGIFGIGGILAVLSSVFFASKNPGQFLVLTATSLIASAILLPFVFKYFLKSKLFQRVVLEEEQNRGDGYISSIDFGNYVGKSGKVLTTLRPAGTAQIGDQKFDVISQGAFIYPGTTVKVIKVEGTRMIVDEVIMEE